MSDLLVAGAGTAPVAAALAITLLLLHRPLAATMGELCGELQRGQFWTYMSEIALVVGTLLVMLLGVLVLPVFSVRAGGIAAALTLLRCGLAGLLLALAAVGAAVLGFTARLGRHAPPAHGAGSVRNVADGGRS